MTKETIQAGKLPTNIYRFLSFESFVDLVLRKALAFVPYHMLQDPYEAFVIRAMQTTSGRRDIIKWLDANNQTGLSSEIRLCVLESFCKTVYLQSWTMLEESDALWRIYAHGGTAVRIHTTIEKVQSLLQNVEYFPVEYEPKLDLEKELGRIFVGNQTKHKEVFSCKRIAFEHEKEFRLLSRTPQSGSTFSRLLPGQRTADKKILMKNALEQMLELGRITQEEFESGIANNDPENDLSPPAVKHMSCYAPDFIKTVTVHPTAVDWFVETVDRFCKANHLTFCGRSELYKFDHR